MESVDGKEDREGGAPEDDAPATPPAAAPGEVVQPAVAEAGGAPTPEATPEGRGAQAERVLELLAQLSANLEETNRLSQERERVVDRLHEENQRLKTGESFQRLLPVFRDLIRLHDDLERSTQAYQASAAAGTQADASHDLACFRDTILEILARQGVEPYDAEEGSTFTAAEQRALRPVPTDDPGKDRTIARVVRRGFRVEGRSVRALEAEVFRCQGGAPRAPNTDGKEN